MGHGGQFLLGSGGANDIATCADETIVTLPQDPQRLVPHVSYVTAPGDHVRTIVTTEAVLERGDDGFVLTRYLDPADGTSSDALLRGVRERTGWDLTVARQPVAEPPPTAVELAGLRAFDPQRVFLGS
jgi:glutaconate CoA-transferase subunit B